ncbi:hypothetical protein APSETT444_010688 [Aspergillus pseudonomiae]
MDKLMSKLGGGSQSKDKEDRLGLDSIEKKFGGGRINPDDPKVRETNEKFTDAARNKLESLTG